ncbi:hypothetical protein INR49_001947 [Caranx melampygus]|nr:hypothetical protein INR49_001947 [Caranx melampygus]
MCLTSREKVLVQQKAKETSETEAAKQPTKTSDSRLRRGHGHVTPPGDAPPVTETHFITPLQ